MSPKYLAFALCALFAAALPIASEDATIVHVKDYEELYTNFSTVLLAPTLNTVFHLNSTNTYVAPANGLKPVNLDFVGAQGWLRNLFSSQNLEWVEFAYHNAERVEYPGFIPASPCQSHEYGDGGSVGFSYSYSQGSTVTSGLGISWVIEDLTLTASAGSSLSLSTTISGLVSCSIGKGKVGQVLLKPSFIRARPLSRRIRYSRDVRKFLFDEDFEKHEEIQRLLLLGAYKIACATSDVVPLFCDTKRFGTDWENPLGADYQI